MANRKGYLSDFLSSDDEAFHIAFPVAGPALKHDVLNFEAQNHESCKTDYLHYSLMMSLSTRQALVSAANFDSSSYISLPSGLGRNWFVDHDIGEQHQITNDYYKRPYPYFENLWDRGHLTRRTAVTWGDYNTALRASNDSCSYANATLQHRDFNEDDWRDIEDFVAKNDDAVNGRFNILTGPFFTTCDRFFSPDIRLPPVRIPTGFWKTVSYIESFEGEDRLRTHALLMFQDYDAISCRAGRGRNLNSYMVTMTELELWTGLEFDPKMYASNALRFYSSDKVEAMDLKAVKILSKDVRRRFQAGIVDESDIADARVKLEKEALFALVQELSWI